MSYKRLRVVRLGPNSSTSDMRDVANKLNDLQEEGVKWLVVHHDVEIFDIVKLNASELTAIELPQHGVMCIDGQTFKIDQFLN